jgi:transcriptional regulator with XRE-family HTH domain
MAHSKPPRETDSTRELGEHLNALRLRQGIDQQTLADRAGIALNAVKNLEAGRNSTVRSLLLVLRALGKEDWIKTLAPQVTISPLQILERKAPRKRAPRRTRATKAKR